MAHELDYVISVNSVVSDHAILQLSGLFYQLIWHRRSYTYQRAFEVAISGLMEDQAAFTLRGCRVPRQIHPSARALSSPRDVAVIDHPGHIPD